MSEQNQAIVRRIIEDYWNKKNPALAGELFAADCSWHIPGGELARGVQGAAALYGPYATAFPDFRLTVEDTVVEGDRVAVSYSFTGTNKARLGAVRIWQACHRTGYRDIPFGGRQSYRRPFGMGHAQSTAANWGFADGDRQRGFVDRLRYLASNSKQTPRRKPGFARALASHGSARRYRISIPLESTAA